MRLNNGYFRSHRSHRAPPFDFESMGDGSVVIVAPKVLAIEGTGNRRVGVIFVSRSLGGQYGQFWTPLRGRNACGHHWLWSSAIVVGVVGDEVGGGLLLRAGHWAAVAVWGHGAQRVTPWAVRHLVWGRVGAEFRMECVLGVFHRGLLVVLAPGGADHGHGAAPGIAPLPVLGGRAHPKLLAHQRVSEDRAVLQGIGLTCLDHSLPTGHLQQALYQIPPTLL